MNLLKYGKLYLIGAVLVIILSITVWSVRGLNYGVDFTGGTSIRFPLAGPVTSPEVVTALGTPELQEVDLRLAPPQPYDYIDSSGRQRFGVLVHTAFLTPEEQKLVVGALEKAFGPAAADTGLEISAVDPLIGRELLLNALYALAIACALILGYIAFRFEFKSGVAGLFALFHDVLLVIGIFALLRREVNGTFIAALLTIIGYSINDSIVLFDRIRENLRYRKKGESFTEIVNFSILQTMRRSLNTSVTTVVMILLLYLLGSPSIKEFCLALLVGLTAGTYSSIFVASSLWAFWRDSGEKRNNRRRAAVAGAR